jgi:hypothetical protein
MKFGSKGKVQNIIWLPAEETLEWNKMAKRKGIASNVLIAQVLSKVLKDKCPQCQFIKLECICNETIECMNCKTKIWKKEAVMEHFCSIRCYHAFISDASK